MSSNFQHVDFPSGVQILQELREQAQYVTDTMRPLAGSLHFPSKSVLRRFIEGSMIPELMK
jgi:hypothetical protein